MNGSATEPKKKRKKKKRPMAAACFWAVTGKRMHDSCPDIPFVLYSVQRSAVLTEIHFVIALRSTFRDQTLENEERNIVGEDQSAWRLRAICRIKRLQEVTIELEQLREELQVATDRYSDAEHAEKVVNKGLKGAHVLLEQREKTINALNHTNANLNAEIAQFTG